uniref:Uncharacterized protein n=1 Tax=Timema douglasi TaxID=61478 RepID=A0A7R8ZCM0_TIMDO|nr:unnamed protein product [Timema douglasi]
MKEFCHVLRRNQTCGVRAVGCPNITHTDENTQVYRAQHYDKHSSPSDLVKGHHFDIVNRRWYCAYLETRTSRGLSQSGESAGTGVSLHEGTTLNQESINLQN